MNDNPSLSILQGPLDRLAMQSRSCKLWSVVLVSAVLLFAVSKGGSAILLWTAAPAGLLVLWDAVSTAQARRIAALAGNLSSKELAGVELKLFREMSGGGGLTETVSNLRGLLSLSVWPYYVALAGIMVTLGQTVLPSTRTAATLPPGATVISPPNMSMGPQSHTLGAGGNGGLNLVHPSSMPVPRQLQGVGPRNVNPITGMPSPTASVARTGVYPQTPVRGPGATPTSPPSVIKFASPPGGASVSPAAPGSPSAPPAVVQPAPTPPPAASTAPPSK